jgi:hypothetical protein
LRRCKVIDRSMINATVTIEAMIRNQMGQPAAWIIENKGQLQWMPTASRQGPAARVPRMACGKGFVQQPGTSAGRCKSARSAGRKDRMVVHMQWRDSKCGMECNIRRTDGTRVKPRIVGFFDRGPQVAGFALHPVDNFVEMAREGASLLATCQGCEIGIDQTAIGKGPCYQ